MAFNVNEFKTRLIGEGARPTLFNAYIFFPIEVGAGMEDFTFVCKSAQLPSQQVGTIELPYFGRRIKVPGDRTFVEWTITVINDETFSVRNAFQLWQSAINSHVGNLRSRQSIYANGVVTQYSKVGDVLKSYRLVDIWPADLSAIDVSWENNDTVEEFTVTLQYNWWEDSTTDSVATSAIVQNAISAG
ncbi:MAG: phage tail protein [Patescibacteria group bacterium]|nr:phage tail protein [Patescibacteria group bacterium]